MGTRPRRLLVRAVASEPCGARERLVTKTRRHHPTRCSSGFDRGGAPRQRGAVPTRQAAAGRRLCRRPRAVDDGRASTGCLRSRCACEEGWRSSVLRRLGVVGFRGRPRGCSGVALQLEHLGRRDTAPLLSPVASKLSKEGSQPRGSVLWIERHADHGARRNRTGFGQRYKRIKERPEARGDVR